MNNIKKEEAAIRQVLNASGYLFQLRIEHEIKQTQKDHHWNVVAREYPWSDDTDEEGFIDLILERGEDPLGPTLIVECKRVRDAKWVFPVQSGHMTRHHAKVLRCPVSPSKGTDWPNYSINPPSAEAEFCTIRGSGEKNKPFLEQVVRKVLRSLECCASEKAERVLQHPMGFPRDFSLVFLPVIVTTAHLFVWEYSAETLSGISLSDGTLNEGDFKEVPFVRFRKTLATYSISLEARDWETATSDKERTVFIVNSSHLINFLRAFSLKSTF